MCGAASTWTDPPNVGSDRHRLFVSRAPTSFLPPIFPTFADLVKTLDARKDEAISRTFKGVAHHFKQVR